jgi:hypothetical protein
MASKKYWGIIPKSWFQGADYYQDISHDETQTYVNATGGEAWWKWMAGGHIFSRKALPVLTEMGYSNNPAGFGIINKILLAQRNIKFVPYWKGKPWKSMSYDLDTNFGLQMLLLTGTCIIYSKEIVGFDAKQVVLNTLDVEEICLGNKKFTYKLNNNDGTWTILDPDKMIFIKIFDPGRKNTQMGLSPLQAALMPIESLKEM